MNYKKISEAKIEAQKFLKKIKELESILTNDDKKFEWLTGSKHTAAVKRASMDLTRALTEMRKP